jgi:hypothetical protein
MPADPTHLLHANLTVKDSIEDQRSMVHVVLPSRSTYESDACRELPISATSGVRPNSSRQTIDSSLANRTTSSIGWGFARGG